MNKWIFLRVIILSLVVLQVGCGTPNTKKLTAEEMLIYAAAKGEVALVERLLNVGLNPNIRDSNDMTPLHYAAQGGQLDIAVLLIQNGADVNATATKDAATPLMRAASVGHVSVVELLLRSRANVDQQDRMQAATALMWAAYKGKYECANRLLQAGALVDVRGRRGETALWLAATAADSRMVGLLLEYGANPGLKHSSGTTPMEEAKKRNDQQMLDLFKRI